MRQFQGQCKDVSAYLAASAAAQSSRWRQPCAGSLQALCRERCQGSSSSPQCQRRPSQVTAERALPEWAAGHPPPHARACRHGGRSSAQVESQTQPWPAGTRVPLRQCRPTVCRHRRIIAVCMAGGGPLTGAEDDRAERGMPGTPQVCSQVMH